ncbi:hypothetical protein [Streptomyces sp. TLI_185]|uniref:hypothetical protein n=1 Tax=Streptomyces sp. TLI_185 TaxID=2485151 RepID=UPI000F4FDD40|nr:hypothetical protein [Streptomyces sp. TLI_185]RPF34194.1 hypothetical protein EDD92_4138 [Streptomyces sp. TLI_185]
MPQHASNTSVCRDCGGFASAAIDTGTRDDEGSRVTLHVDCPSCRGTGHTARTARLARTGR